MKSPSLDKYNSDTIDRDQQSRPPSKFECSFAGCTKSYNARSYLVEHERQVIPASTALSSSYFLCSVPDVASYLKISNFFVFIRREIPVHIMHFISPGLSDVPTDNPNCVLLGLAPSHFHYERLNEAFRLIQDEGATLVAIHKAKYLKRKDRLAIGPGRNTIQIVHDDATLKT